MIFRRVALAIGLVFAALASQLPEYTQQYRQRIGGAVDELNAMIETFDGQASAQSLSREQAIARLEDNGDQLARQRGASMAETVARRDRLTEQKSAFVLAGPVSQFVVLAEKLDPGIARQAMTDFQPALPVTVAGFVSAAVGLAFGWLLAHALAWPMRRRRVDRLPATTAA